MVHFFENTVWLKVGSVLLAFATFFMGCENEDDYYSWSHEPTTAEETDQKVLAATRDWAHGDVNHLDVVVRVNERDIRQADVERRVERIAELYRHTRRPFDAEMREVKRIEVVERLVDQELLRQYISTRGISLAPDAVDRKMEERIKTRFGTAETFRRYLETEGISAADFRRKLHDEMALEALLEEEISIDVPSEEALREHFERIAQRRPVGERVRASTFSIRVPTNADEATKLRIRESLQESLQRVDSGDSFLQLAERIGQGGNTSKLEQLRWVERHQLHPLAGRAIFGTSMDSGLSEIITTPMGFEVYWVHERRPAGIRQFDEVKAHLHYRARQAALAERREQLIKELREEASIQIDENLVHTIR